MQRAVFVALALPFLCLASEPPCKTFQEIYGNGKNLCERMWNDAFVYETNPSLGYTMWFYSDGNPNDAVTEALAAGGSNALHGYNGSHVNDCLDYNHKESPSPEEGMTECLPWASRSCCRKDVVSSPQKLKEAYGEHHHWDRCGPLSPACERFFVEEACFYECEPAASLFRLYPVHPNSTDHPNHYNSSNSTHNKWQIHRMPIKASYCDQWFKACRNDLFCAHDNGNYFSCGREYKRVDTEKETIVKTEDKLATHWIVTIAIISFLAVTAIVCGVYLIIRERQGRPVYNPVSVGPNGTEMDQKMERDLKVEKDQPTD